MPLRSRTTPKFSPPKDVEIKWESFTGGWNNLFKPTELKSNELAQADNMMLVGAGTPTGRWGSQIYHLAGGAGKIRMLDAYYNSLTSTNLLLSITDQGYLTQRNNASYSIIPGASFPSGSNYFFTQLGGFGYINGPSIPLVKLSGTSLIPYIPLAVPTNVSVAVLSAASGFHTYSWVITANSLSGETDPSVGKALVSLPLALASSSIKVSWNSVSAASGVLTGYTLYRGLPGDETLLATVGPNVTSYFDTGEPTSDIIFPPLTNTTGGPRAKFRLKFNDRIILAGIDGEPNKVLVSGRYPYHDRFTAADGGGSTYVSPDDGDDITGLSIANLQNPFPVVLKHNSSHVLSIDTIQLGNFNILDITAQVLTNSNGCSSADTIKAVENDYFYFGYKGLYVIGQQQNFLNQIRTNELSARIRSYVRDLSEEDFKSASAEYIDNKYILSFPIKRETVIYDRERNCFMGPWKTPWGINKWLKYFDISNNETWLAATDSGPYVREFSPSFITDSGTAITKVLRTKKEDMGNWSVMKILKLLYVLFRNVRGDVTINLLIETRDGSTQTSKSFNINSSLESGGWGNDQWGSMPYGDTDADISLTGEELVRWTNIYKNCRVVQIEVTSSGANANFEFLATRFTAQPLGDSSLPASTRV